jgi:hypothetical protein
MINNNNNNTNNNDTYSFSRGVLYLPVGLRISATCLPKTHIIIFLYFLLGWGHDAKSQT